MKTILAVIIFILASTGVAHADPISALIGAIAAGISSAATAVTAALGGLVSFAGLGAFLASPIGNLVLGLGLQLLLSPFLSKRQQQTPSIEAGKINVRVAEPERWSSCGNIRMGGGVVFAEFDTDGNFWYVVVHSDSLHSGITKRYFDDIEIEIDGSGNVLTNDFCLDNDGNVYVDGAGGKNTYFQIFSTTYTEANVTPPAISALAAAFPGVDGWTANHKLVGTTYSVVKILPLSMEYRYKIYKWRGPVGVGEPAVSMVANWSNVYDPRDGSQTLGNRSTYEFRRNPVLIWAWFRTLKYGRGKSEASINWSKIAEKATICDGAVIDKDGGVHVRYQCDVAIPESKERATAEQEILLSCDGQIVFDEDGKCWVQPGAYYTPTLSLSRNRDIAGVESVEAQNGESETQGVIVRYLDPEAKYLSQPAAAWDNPNYFVPGETPKYLTLDILSCQDHNQAMRLAKAYGLRSQPIHKLLPTVGLRGMKARQERIIDFNYDNTFAGDYEIVTPVEVDETGAFTGFGIVPVDENRWNLLPGEEKDKPVLAEIDDTSSPALPTSVLVAFDGSRLTATFDPTPRKDWQYKFQYKLDTDTQWSDMRVEMLTNFTYSGGVKQNRDYQVRWRTISNGGKPSPWVSPVTTINTTILTLGGTPVTTGKVGVAYTNWTCTASGGTPPYAFYDVFGKLPPGITINVSTGVVSGTPTLAGTYSGIVIRVIDSDAALANKAAFTITVIP